MPEFDTASLNEQAKALYDIAFERGAREGHAKAERLYIARQGDASIAAARRMVDFALSSAQLETPQVRAVALIALQLLNATPACEVDRVTPLLSGAIEDRRGGVDLNRLNDVAELLRAEVDRRV